MILNYHRQFQKDYLKLRKNEKERVNEAIKRFKKDPYDPILRNHILKGEIKDRRVICAGGDLRLIFREYQKYTFVLFLGVGSHNQVY